MYNELIDVIRNAKKYIYLTTPYFVPDLRLLRVIRLAAKRGVDVRLLVPYYSGTAIVDLAGQSHFTLLLKAGVKIFRYRENMLHAKTAVIDGSWGTAGSLNLDSLSFSFNYELNVVSHDTEFVEELKNNFLEDLKESKQVNASEWYNRYFWRKILEGITWPLHRLL